MLRGSWWGVAAGVGGWEGTFFPQEENFSLPAEQSRAEQPYSWREAPWSCHLLGTLSWKWGSAVSFSPAPLQCDCIWFGLLFLTFLLSLGWLYIGLILLNDLHNFNECVTDPPLPLHTC